MPPSEPVPGLGSGGRISYVDFLLHKAQVGQCRLTRHSIIFGDGSPSVHARGQTSPSLESTTQISGEVTTRSTKPVSSPGSTTTWSSASKMWPISSSRASSGRIPAHRRSQVSRDDRTTKDGSKSYLLRLLCSAASTACGRQRAVGLWPLAVWCLGPMLTSREAACDGRHRAWRAGSRETRRLGGLRQAASRGPSGPSEKKQCCAERS